MAEGAPLLREYISKGCRGFESPLLRHYSCSTLDLDSFGKLLKILKRYQLKDPDRWTHQALAIIDNKEMVEIRHGLIVRRQSLRSQLDYNQKVAETASNEIREVATLYPQYKGEISDLLDRYQGN